MSARMSVTCQKVTQSKLKSRAVYEGVNEFVLVQRSDRPSNIAVAQKWTMDLCFMPIHYQEIAQKILHLDVRPDDIWLVGFPKSGTTWCQEMIWLISNNLDYDRAKLKLFKRFPQIEIFTVIREPSLPDYTDKIKSMPSPRFVKSHLPLHLLPEQLWTVRPKIVYVARNVKDLVISTYHQYINFQAYEGTFEDFLDVFLNKETFYAPYPSHVKDFYGMRHEENILFLTYEDMKKDLPKVLRSVAQFFGKNYTEDQIQGLAEHLSFTNIAKNPFMNHETTGKRREAMTKEKKKNQTFRFMRKGECGSYFDEMTLELIKRFDMWTEKEMERLDCDPKLRNVFNFDY